MNIILLEGIRGLGKLGDTVVVKPGYARNCLLPKGKAVAATAANLKVFADKKSEFEKLENDRVAAARLRASQLEKLHLTISAKVSEEGKLYGSVGATEIVNAILAAGVEANRHEVQLSQGPFRALGDDMEVKLNLYHGDVTAVVKLNIVADKT